MVPPWVIFDSIAWYDGDCANGADPDIAGVGVSIAEERRPYRLTVDVSAGCHFFRLSKRHDDCGLCPRDDP